MRWLLACCIGCASALIPGRIPATESPSAADTITAYRGARIYPVSGPLIERGVLLVQKGKIIGVGPEDQIATPEGAAIHEVTGKTIIPGLVDTHSHIGIYPRPSVPANGDGNEMTGPVQPGLRALDSIFPDDPGIRMAVAGGITTANIMPGSGNAIGGQTVYVKLRGRTIEAMRIPDTRVLGGLKMANGENPKGYGRRAQPQAPVTRMKVASLQREQFVKARDYQRQWANYRKAVAAGKEIPQPDTDLSLEPLVEVLERKRTVHFHTHRADDLLTALRIALEFDFEIVLHHATEGYRVVQELVRRKVPASLTLVDSPGGKLEAAALLEENAAILDKAGVMIAINTDDFITESRFFLRTGAIAVRGGLSEEAALRALTLNPARMLHLEDRVGSLEKGKMRILSSSRDRLSASIRKFWRPTSTACASSTALGRTGRIKRAASLSPTRADCPKHRLRCNRRRRSRPPPSRRIPRFRPARFHAWQSSPAAFIPSLAEVSVTEPC
jgi:imidazolonepropionase-like amidohydrolase